MTIVGYSLNDTVVVYDRMRENLRRYPRMPLPILIDASINQTLSRTILTAATTLLALLALVLFGGEVIRSFAFVMLFGVAVGTFSSIYIAAPVLILFRLRPEDRPTRMRTGGGRRSIRQRPQCSHGKRYRNPRGAFSRPRTDRHIRQWRLPLCRHVASRLAPLPAFRHLRLGHGRWSMPLSAENFQKVLDEAADIEVLLVGTGTELRRLPAELKAALKARGISSDPMSTGAAVRTFNIMLCRIRAPSPRL